MIRTDGTPTIANSEALVASVPDFSIRREGNLFLVTPNNQAARNWAVDNLLEQDTQVWGTAIVVEHGYIEEVFDGLVDDGFTVS